MKLILIVLTLMINEIKHEFTKYLINLNKKVILLSRIHDFKFNSIVYIDSKVF